MTENEYYSLHKGDVIQIDTPVTKNNLLRRVLHSNGRERKIVTTTVVDIERNFVKCSPDYVFRKEELIDKGRLVQRVIDSFMENELREKLAEQIKHEESLTNAVNNIDCIGERSDVYYVVAFF